MLGDDLAGVVYAGAAGQAGQAGGLRGQVLPADRAAEQCGGRHPDLLLRVGLLLGQEVDHLGVEPALDPVPAVGEVLYLGGFVHLAQPADQAVPHTAEGGGHCQDVIHVLVDELQTLSDQVGNLKFTPQNCAWRFA